MLVKSKVKISQNFVAISEYMNFKKDSFLEKFDFNELKLIVAVAFRNFISGVTQLNSQITYSLVWVRDTLDIWPQTSAETAQVIT